MTAPTACLLCTGPVAADQPRCPAFALAGVAAHAGCCGGCTTANPGQPQPARVEIASTATVEAGR